MAQTEWMTVKEAAFVIGCTERAVRNYIKRHEAERDGNGVPFLAETVRNGKTIVTLSAPFVSMLTERYGKAAGERYGTGNGIEGTHGTQSGIFYRDRAGTERAGTGGMGTDRTIRPPGDTGSGAQLPDVGTVVTASASGTAGDLEDNQQRGDGRTRGTFVDVSSESGIVSELYARIATLETALERERLASDHAREAERDLRRLLDQQQKLTAAAEQRLQLSAVQDDDAKKNMAVYSTGLANGSAVRETKARMVLSLGGVS